MSVELLDPVSRQSGEGFITNSWPQTRFIESEAPQLLLSGHIGSGKTRPLNEKADMRCRVHARARVAICRRYRVDLGLSTLKKFLDETVTPGERAWGWRASAEGGSTMHYPNGSETVFAGLDNPGKVLSAEFDLVLVDEAQEMNEEAWNTLAGRLRWKPEPSAATGEVAFRQIAGACNPGPPTHFLFRKFRPDQGSHRVFSEAPVRLRSGTIVPAGRLVAECLLAGETDNEENLDEPYLVLLQGFKGKFRDRYVLGRWVLFEGVTYGDVWDPEVHCPAMPAEWRARWGGYPDPRWPRYRFIDFGFHNPFVCSWYARDPDGVFWRYREIYMSGRTVPEHKATMIEQEDLELAGLRAAVEKMDLPPKELNALRPERLPFYGTICDHDAGDRAILESNSGGRRIITKGAVKNDVAAGVKTLYEMLASKRVKFVKGARIERDRNLGDGKPTCTEEELPFIHYPKDQDSALARNRREIPVKEDDHGHDACWYGLHTLRVTPKVAVYR